MIYCFFFFGQKSYYFNFEKKKLKSFGTGEGKTAQILQAEARKKNIALKDYIPSGGENNEQVNINKLI
jgi:hypothetical protein